MDIKDLPEGREMMMMMLVKKLSLLFLRNESTKQQYFSNSKLKSTSIGCVKIGVFGYSVIY